MMTGHSRHCYIYGLCDPETGDVFYIGKSVDPDKRFAAHLSKQPNPYLAERVAALKDRGVMPRLDILECTDQDHWQERERWWIAHGRSNGSPLANITNGGQAGPGKGGLSAIARAICDMRLTLGRLLSTDDRGMVDKLTDDEVKAIGINAAYEAVLLLQAYYTPPIGDKRHVDAFGTVEQQVARQIREIANGRQGDGT